VITLLPLQWGYNLLRFGGLTLMANKVKIVVSLLLAVSLGALVYGLSAKGYAAPNTPGSLKQALQQSKDKNVVVEQINGDGSWGEVAQGKLYEVGEDFIMVLYPVGSLPDKSNTLYVPFTSIQRVEKPNQGGTVIRIR
jgi:hypothetical protein